MEVIDYSRTVRTTDVIHIKDEELNYQWFIGIEKTDGKFVSGREMVNPNMLSNMGDIYIQKVYDLAWDIVNSKNRK